MTRYLVERYGPHGLVKRYGGELGFAERGTAEAVAMNAARKHMLHEVVVVPVRDRNPGCGGRARGG